LSNQYGAVLLLVLVLVVVLGLAAGMAGSTWLTVTQRAKVEKLIWRGDQYPRAIASHYKFKHAAGIGKFSTKLEDLFQDSRSLQKVRHIRQLYKDPMTGEDFVPIRQGDKVEGAVTATPGPGGILGVRSASDLEPFKQDSFRSPDEKFAGTESFARWEFVYRPEQDKVTPQAPSPQIGSPLQPIPGSPLPSPAEGILPLPELPGRLQGNRHP